MSDITDRLTKNLDSAEKSFDLHYKQLSEEIEWAIRCARPSNGDVLDLRIILTFFRSSMEYHSFIFKRIFKVMLETEEAEEKAEKEGLICQI